jgi:UDPglucose 6-dehydrogenase
MVAILTEWNEFRDLHFDRVKEKIRTPNIYDTRNIYDPEQIRKLGFNYYGTGRAGRK